MVFAELTGSRVPVPLLSGAGEVRRVAFCPSAHLGVWLSYVLTPPDLIVFFDAPAWLARLAAEQDPERAPSERARGTDGESPNGAGATLSTSDMLETLRALADPTRLQILDLLDGGELYAQEIVGRLGIVQSAVSRHLSLLERAGLLVVEPRRGMKYYRVSNERLRALATAIARRGERHDAAAAPDAVGSVAQETATVPERGARP
jgi:ArsR family transcriptional regulator